MAEPQVKRALISVTDKSGIVEFARTLHDEFGVEIISTGGTARVMSEAGVPVVAIDDYTGFPEMMDGRVKTLHPKVHGGLLARRMDEGHMADAKANGISMIDMVVVNLYEFEKTVAKADVTFADAIEHIDIGGPSMLRSAAKNHESVAVVTDPASYDVILGEMRENAGATTALTRKKLALEVFRLTSAYDNAIYSWMAKEIEPEVEFKDDERVFMTKIQDLRYGENPHQKAAYYRAAGAGEHCLANAQQLAGKALSYNNILDTDACWACVREFDEPAVIVLKHQNPCGSAVGENVVEAYDRAFACDPISAFGGIIAVNREVPGEFIQHILDNKQFVEVIIAPSFEASALTLLEAKPNIRVLATGGVVSAQGNHEVRTMDGGFLIQETDVVSEDPATFTCPTERKATDAELADLLFAWKVVKNVKSNAILVAKNKAGIGMGPGQPNRVDSARLALGRAGEEAKGAVAASDAFFPFRDNIDVLAEAGITAIIQPGGSIRDQESIDACNEHGIAMIYTGTRHFRH